MSKINAYDEIRERHHAQARLLAAGRSPSEVAHLMGVSEARVVRQSADPTFRELVARYRAKFFKD
jgi:hypothetical protein